MPTVVVLPFVPVTATQTQRARRLPSNAAAAAIAAARRPSRTTIAGSVGARGSSTIAAAAPLADAVRQEVVAVALASRAPRRTAPRLHARGCRRVRSASTVRAARRACPTRRPASRERGRPRLAESNGVTATRTRRTTVPAVHARPAGGGVVRRADPRPGRAARGSRRDAARTPRARTHARDIGHRTRCDRGARPAPRASERHTHRRAASSSVSREPHRRAPPSPVEITVVSSTFDADSARGERRCGRATHRAPRSPPAARSSTPAPPPCRRRSTPTDCRASRGSRAAACPRGRARRTLAVYFAATVPVLGALRAPCRSCPPTSNVARFAASPVPPSTTPRSIRAPSPRRLGGHHAAHHRALVPVEHRAVGARISLTIAGCSSSPPLAIARVRRARAAAASR